MKCEHDGCKERADGEWRIEGYDPVPVFHFCDEHAAEFGFCLYCGHFIGGTEDVFLTGQNGVCFDCYRELPDEIEDDDYWDGVDYPDDKHCSLCGAWIEDNCPREGEGCPYTLPINDDNHIVDVGNMVDDKSEGA